MRALFENLRPIGNGLYEDDKGRLIIGDLKNKKGWLITKSERKTYNLYQYRFIVPLLLLVIPGFYINWILGIVLSVVSFAVFTYLYRKSFLEKLTCYEGIEFPERATRRHRIMEQETRVNWLYLAGTLALPVLLFVNLFDQIDVWDVGVITADFNKLALVAVTVLISVYSLYMAFLTLSVIIQKTRKQ